MVEKVYPAALNACAGDAEDTVFCTYPLALSSLERLRTLCEILSVGTVTDAAEAFFLTSNGECEVGLIDRIRSCFHLTCGDVAYDRSVACSLGGYSVWLSRETIGIVVDDLLYYKLSVVILCGYATVATSHDDEARLLSFALGRDGNMECVAESLTFEFLKIEVAYVPEIEATHVSIFAIDTCKTIAVETEVLLIVGVPCVAFDMRF